MAIQNPMAAFKLLCAMPGNLAAVPIIPVITLGAYGGITIAN